MHSPQPTIVHTPSSPSSSRRTQQTKPATHAGPTPPAPPLHRPNLPQVIRSSPAITGYGQVVAGYLQGIFGGWERGPEKPKRRREPPPPLRGYSEKEREREGERENGGGGGGHDDAGGGGDRPFALQGIPRPHPPHPPPPPPPPPPHLQSPSPISIPTQPKIPRTEYLHLPEPPACRHTITSYSRLGGLLSALVVGRREVRTLAQLSSAPSTWTTRSPGHAQGGQKQAPPPAAVPTRTPPPPSRIVSPLAHVPCPSSRLSSRLVLSLVYPLALPGLETRADAALAKGP
ncbi:hypothetical protein CH63R_02474 [Colletotrichum higginsianum IMI 349063]|uniref:Uncharacterized protein n=1 Tax=Colletotrichum higginsianum (strain IMI 349063) TaxID=759273 RepID=A0A1B7YPD4_COLHI|nr:hypothetical protein CH63R_02474 [Colletotrichum higginsianum IMI 349063]OBR13748.1 hypothetical protein CH63R_02474 [Colletotrichum higginsianum IMI 349063]